MMTPDELLRVLNDSVQRLDKAAQAADENGDVAFNEKVERQLQITATALFKALQDSGRIEKQDTSVEITIVDSLATTNDSSEGW